MRLPRAAKNTAVVFGIVLLFLGFAYFYAITPHHSSAPAESADGLLDRADTLSWGNRWAAAQPLYHRAQQQFVFQHRLSRALYAQVSQVPANESANIPSTIGSLTEDLGRPEAADPETRLRILTIRGMLETNYNAAEGRSTWQQVESLAIRLHHLALATRAVGEQGIAAFILGDTETAKKQVIRAWALSKAENDPAATVRYASVFGAGLVQIHRYKEALTPLDIAIKLASKRNDVAYPTIAVYAKIDALAGLRRYDEALALANESLNRLQGTAYESHKSQVYLSLGSVNRDRGDWNAAIVDYQQSAALSSSVQNYRGITDVNGLLAQAYEHNGELPEALAAINCAIAANTKIPSELYLVPRNLAIKADIESRMGNVQKSDVLYRKSIALVDVMLQHATTTNIQRQLLSEMSDVYSDYFSSLCAQKRYDEALETLERIRGRLETEALEHHAAQAPHMPTSDDRELTHLNIALINADDPATRESLTNAIYSTELRISPSALAQATAAHTVHLTQLQRSLSKSALLIEYVLGEPNSFAFAVTRSSITPYRLPSKSAIEMDSNRYRREILRQKTDQPLAHHLFSELLEPIKEYAGKTDLVIVPDGSLHLLPFSALFDDSSYVLKTHTIDVAPSSTVFDLLSKRVRNRKIVSMPYIGVAAWTQLTDTRNPIVRAITGPERSQLVPLPDSKREVETIAGDLPRPSTILLGSDATESRFKHLSSESTDVIHLALHGYADLDYPDRSALIFAPDSSQAGDDGLLQVREIRHLHLQAKLVTLSACNTGVGPVGQAGIANLVNAFIEAGADSVVSTLWDLEDHTTEHLMTQFYGHLSHRERKVEALRDAQVELLNRGLAPYYWASFQVVGEPNGTL